jgi:hypothetical protein
MRPYFCLVWYHWRAGQYGMTQGHPGMGGGGGSTYGTAEELSIQLERGNTVVMQTKWRSIVEGVVICSWLYTDCWFSFKSLVPNDKRFNCTKVWCTFMFIDLQATSCVSSAYICYNGNYYCRIFLLIFPTFLLLLYKRMLKFSVTLSFLYLIIVEYYY